MKVSQYVSYIMYNLQDNYHYHMHMQYFLDDFYMLLSHIEFYIKYIIWFMMQFYIHAYCSAHLFVWCTCMV